MSLDCGRKLDHAEETHKGTWKTGRKAQPTMNIQKPAS